MSNSLCPPISSLHSCTNSLWSKWALSLQLRFGRRVLSSSTSSQWVCRAPLHSQKPAYHPLQCWALDSHDHQSNRDLGSDQSEKNYEFRDDKADVELRVHLPENKRPVSASNVFVDAQETSLSVALVLSTGLLNLFPMGRLYGRIKPAETVCVISQPKMDNTTEDKCLQHCCSLVQFYIVNITRFVDEDEIVISLKKFNKDLAWPDIFEEWDALKGGVSNMLKGLSVYIVGESTEINWAVARVLAEGLEYVPLQTGQLLEQATKKSVERMVADEGADNVADAEAMILSTLNAHVRLVVGTLGGNYGAASRKTKWNNLHAGVTIWLSQTQATDEASAEQEAVNAKQQGTMAYANAETVVSLSGWEDDSAQPAAEGCLRALKYLLESEKDLPGKKSLYVRLGCRGDWPNIMPPGWDPAGGEGKTGKVMAL